MHDKTAHYLKTALLILLISVLAFIPMGCSSDRPDHTSEKEKAPASRSGKKVNVIRLQGGDWGYPTPYAHYPRGPGGFKMCLIFDSLLERDETGLIPWLATDWKVLDDGGTYEFTIREQVKWQDGEPLTPEDVKFSLEYASKHPMTWSYIFKKIESVELKGENTVRVTVSEPGAPMLYNIGRTRILPEHIWKDVENPKEFVSPEAVIGSGPYRLTDYSKSQGTYRFEAFEDFWGPDQRVETIEYVPVSQGILAFEKGDIDMTRVPPDVVSRFEKKPDCKIVKSPGFWGYRLLFNLNERKVLENPKVRQAFLYALDLEELVQKVARGAAIPGNPGILPPDHIMYCPDVKSYGFDPEKAENLLDKSGFKKEPGKTSRADDNGRNLQFELVCSAEEVRMAEVIRERLNGVGFDVRIRSMDAKSRDSMVHNKTYELAVLGHGGWGSDADYLRTRFMGASASGSLSPSDSGLSGYNNPELNELLQKQHVQTDPRMREKTVCRIQKILAKEVPEIPLFYTTSYTVYRPEKYDGWMFMYDHHSLEHSKLSYLERKKRTDQ
jgi:peptide/nickel transport system substrate-binding protein